MINSLFRMNPGLTNRKSRFGFGTNYKTENAGFSQMHRDELYAAGAIVIIAILAGGLVYQYDSANAQISSLKSDGRNLCSSVSSVVDTITRVYDNTTQTMQQQIQEDNAMIVTLNSTRPSGYSSMISTLQSEISQDLAIVSSMNDFSSLTSTGGGPCTPFR